MCFTCGYHIGPVIDRVKRFEETLYLSPQDAIDKAQVKKECCRMTVAAQSGVEERVRAVGRPVTGPLGVMTVEIPEGATYPSQTILRKPLEAPERTVKLANNLGMADYTVYQAIKPGMNLQKEVARGSSVFDRPKKPLAESGPPSFMSIFVPGWDIANPISYPKVEWLYNLRPEDKPIYIAVAPFSDSMVKFMPKRDEEKKKVPVNIVQKLVHDLAVFVKSPSEIAQSVILKKTPVAAQHPDLLLQIFEKIDTETAISLSEVYGNKMIIRKVSKYPGGEGIILEFDVAKNLPYHQEPKYSSFVGRLENQIKGKEVVDAEDTTEGLILSLEDNIELKIESYDIYAEKDTATSILIERRVRSVVLSRSLPNTFMIVFAKGEELAVLVVTGLLTGSKDDKALDIVYPF